MAMTDPVTGDDLYERHFEVGTRITDKVSLKLDPGSELAQFIDSLIPAAVPGTPGTDHRPTAVGIDADIVHQHGQGVQDLRNAAALVGGVQMDDVLAVQPARPRINLSERRIGHEVAKVFQPQHLIPRQLSEQRTDVGHRVHVEPGPGNAQAHA